MQKHKVTIYNVLFILLVLLLAANKNKSLNPLDWGYGTSSFILLVIPTGILVFVSIANENLRNITHWVLLGLSIFILLFVIFEQIYPGLK